MKTAPGPRSRRLAVVLNDSIDAITVHDLSGKILAWNKSAESMYGYSEAEALGMDIAQMVPECKRLEAMRFLERIRSGEVVESFETQRTTKDGRVLDVWLVVTCLRDDSGKINSIATTERDITETGMERGSDADPPHGLKGVLPICASCKRIRDATGRWHELEAYIQDHSEAEFSHGICPECAKRLYPEFKTGVGQAQ